MKSIVELAKKTYNKGIQLISEYQYEKAIQILDVDSNPKLKTSFLDLDGYNANLWKLDKMICHFFLGDYKSVLSISGEILDQISPNYDNETIIERKNNLPDEKKVLIHIKTVVWKTYALFRSVEYDKFKSSLQKLSKLLNEYSDFFDESSNVLNERDRMELKSHSLILQEYSEWQQGNFDTAENLMEKCLTIATQYDFPFIQGTCFLNFGVIHSNKGDILKSNDFFLSSLKIYREINYYPGIPLLLFNLGGNYKQLGDLDKAAKYYMDCAKKRPIFNDSLLNGCALGELGIIKRQLGDFDKSYEMIQKSVEIIKEYGDIDDLVIHLYYLILIEIDRKNYDKSKIILNELKEITQNSNNKLFHLHYNLANAIILKSSNKFREKFQAQEILYEIVQDQVLLSEISEAAILNLAETLFAEYILSKDEKVLLEIRDLAIKLKNIAENQKSYLTNVEALFLLAKIQYIQGKFAQSRRNLAEAQELAEKWGYIRLAIKISNVHDSILNERLELEKRLSIVDIENQIHVMKSQKVEEDVSFIQENPEFILILNESNDTIFSYHFTKDIEVSDEIISSYLSAFNSFCNEVFSECFDRAKIGSYMVVMRNVKKSFIYYVFKGQTISALRKINSLANLIENDATINSFLEKAVQDIKPIQNPIFTSKIISNFQGKSKSKGIKF